MPLHGRRINMFARNLYRYGLLGRFIGVLHVVARLHGKRLQDILAAKTPEEQRAIFDKHHRALVRQQARDGSSRACRSAITVSVFRRRNMTSSSLPPMTAIR